MSRRHFILDQLGPDLSLCDDNQVRFAIDNLLQEHQQDWPSLEERAARAEALAILCIELLMRAKAENDDG